MTEQKIFKVIFKVEGLDDYFTIEPARLMFEAGLPTLKNLFFQKYNELADLLNPHYEKWNQELKNEGITGNSENYYKAIREKQMKIVDKYNKVSRSDVISMDIDEEDSSIIGHIINLNNGNNKIYFVFKEI